jgi:AcrR family transcriptional regulator
MATTTERRPGRPRSETIDTAIREATIEELIERGFPSLSMEAVAARAGVAKTTLYRRWPSPIDLALDAVGSFHADLDEPPAGSARDTLLYLLERMRHTWADPRYGALMRRVAADGTQQPELYRHCRDTLIAPRIRIMNEAIERAVAEGLIRPDVDVGWVRQMLASPILASVLTHRERVTRAQLEFTLDSVLRGLAPQPCQGTAAAQARCEACQR